VLAQEPASERSVVHVDRVVDHQHRLVVVDERADRWEIAHRLDGVKGEDGDEKDDRGARPRRVVECSGNSRSWRHHVGQLSPKSICRRNFFDGRYATGSAPAVTSVECLL
jgi:hypothetical protein